MRVTHTYLSSDERGTTAMSAGTDWRTDRALAAAAALSRATPAPDALLALGRDLTAYADIVMGGAQ